MTDDLKERLLDENVTGFNLTIAAVEAAERIEQLERENQRLRMALADAEALEIGTGERCMALLAHVERLEAKLAAAQAKIDELMLEYCPEEMTPEQIAEWGRNQEAC